MKQTTESASDGGDTISYEIPAATRHDFSLASGRNLSYYTFDTGPFEKPNLKPVLYFHGFPGCGLEGAVCASEVAESGGKLFAPDRPGMGHSDPYESSLSTADQQVESFVNDIWEFIIQNKWDSFSIIAVSGGGPFCLAFLSFYLKKQSQASSSTTLPKLDAVSLVAAVCCSAGSEGMMETNKSLMNIVANQDKMLDRLTLKLMFALPSVLVKVLPSSWILAMSPTKDLPPPDIEAFSDSQVSDHMVDVVCLALRQGHSGAVNEACIIFRSKQGCESFLKAQQAKDPPKISIYQGKLDVNVPKSHATFMQEELFGGAPRFVEYPELGHLSLVVNKANEYGESI